jgi:hypothetical protein
VTTSDEPLAGCFKHPIDEAASGAHPARMGIGTTIEAQGIGRDGVRLWGVTAVFVTVTMTAYGLLAPTSMTWLDSANTTSTDDLVSPMFGAAVAFLGSIVVAVLVGAPLVKRGRRSPAAGPDQLRRGRPTFSMVLATGSLLLMADLKALLPAASGPYPVPGLRDSWLRVNAPVDLAYGAIAGLLLWTLAWVVAVFMAYAWTLFKATIQPNASEAGAR